MVWKRDGKPKLSRLLALGLPTCKAPGRVLRDLLGRMPAMLDKRVSSVAQRRTKALNTKQ